MPGPRWLAARRFSTAGLIVLMTTTLLPGAGRALPTPLDALIRTITLPVQGPFSYSADFGDPRSGHTHEGNDLMVAKMRPLLAATDAKVRRVKVADGGNEGNMLVLRDSAGWEYWYIHINNDTPGSDDGLNPLQHAFAPGIKVGATVKAGAVVAYAGDSGNAEGTGSHLHFEIHQPDGTPIDPYASLRIAQGFRFGNHCAFDRNPEPDPDEASATGYWLLGSDGGIFTFGGAQFLGSTGNIKLNQPAVAMAATPGGGGYWFSAADGGIFSFGDATFYGSTGGTKLNQPIVGLAATPSGKGYWLVARDGGIFSFGDAAFFGSTGDVKLNQPIVGMAATPSGKGYWLVARDGGIFSFGDAAFFGSTGDVKLNQPIISMAVARPVTMTTSTTTTSSTTTTTRRSTTTTTTMMTTTTTGQNGPGSGSTTTPAPPPAATGYWLLAKDGGVFNFGSAGYYGSLPGTGLCSHPTAARLVASSTGRGYWIAGTDGSLWPMGDAADLGSPASLGVKLGAPVLDLVTVPPALTKPPRTTVITIKP